MCRGTNPFLLLHAVAVLSGKVTDIHVSCPLSPSHRPVTEDFINRRSGLGTARYDGEGTGRRCGRLPGPDRRRVPRAREASG
jgi:hypothetical protein